MFKNIKSIIIFFFSQQKANSLNEALTNGSKCQDSAKETKIDWFWKWIIFVIIFHLWVCRYQSKMPVRGMPWPFKNAIILGHLIFLLYYRFFFFGLCFEKKQLSYCSSPFFFCFIYCHFMIFFFLTFFLSNEKY